MCHAGSNEIDHASCDFTVAGFLSSGCSRPAASQVGVAESMDRLLRPFTYLDAEQLRGAVFAARVEGDCARVLVPLLLRYLVDGPVETRDKMGDARREQHLRFERFLFLRCALRPIQAGAFLSVLRWNGWN